MYMRRLIAVCIALLLGVGSVTLVFASTIKKQAQRIVADAKPAVVMVSGYRTIPNSKTGEKYKASSGTAFFITTDGYLITNYHVVADADTEYRIDDGKRELSARIVTSDKSKDLAVLKIEGKSYTALTFGDSSTVVKGGHLS